MIASRQPLAVILSLGGMPIDLRPMVASSTVPQGAAALNAPGVRSPTQPSHDAVDIGYPSAGSDEGAITATEAETVGLGMLIALLWVVAGALVLAVLIAGIVFGVDGIGEFSWSDTFLEFATWGGVAVVLAAVCTEGWYRDRRRARHVSTA
jgi:hypothetical protein